MCFPFRLLGLPFCFQLCSQTNGSGDLRVAAVMTGHAVLGHRVPRRQKLIRIGPVMFPHGTQLGFRDRGHSQEGFETKDPCVPIRQKTVVLSNLHRWTESSTRKTPKKTSFEPQPKRGRSRSEEPHPQNPGPSGEPGSQQELCRSRGRRRGQGISGYCFASDPCPSVTINMPSKKESRLPGKAEVYLGGSGI